jgi:hypothetical protein
MSSGIDPGKSRTLSRPGLEEDSSQLGGSGPGPGSRLWPILIGVGLALVILVNGIFIFIALRGADQVVPSYVTEER